MRKKSIGLVACALLAASIVTGTAFAAKPVVVKAGNLVFTINGGVKPKALSKTKMEPIALNVAGHIATVDGTHPPALTSVVVDTDKNGTIDARGVPTCKQGQLEARTTAAAEKACKRAIVGTGTTDVQVQFPESQPFVAKSKLLALNGGIKGKTTTIFIHAYLTSPVSASVVTTVKVTKRKEGPYGIRSIATIPKIAGGSGSVVDFNLDIDKKLFKYKGKRHGYLLAKCPSGRFKARAESIYADGTKVKGTIVRPCRPKG